MREGQGIGEVHEEEVGAANGLAQPGSVEGPPGGDTLTTRLAAEDVEGQPQPGHAGPQALPAGRAELPNAFAASQRRTGRSSDAQAGASPAPVRGDGVFGRRGQALAVGHRLGD